LSSHPRSDISHQQREIHYLEQQEATHAPGYMYVSGVDIWKWGGRRPDELRGVGFDRSQHAGYYAYQNRGQQDVAPRILGFF